MSDIVLGAIIGAGAVLAANLIGLAANWRTSKKAEEHWRREQRRSAYAEMVRASDKFQRSAEDLYRKSQPPNPDEARLAAELDAAMKELDHAASQVQLLGSSDSQAAVNALWHQAATNIYPWPGRSPRPGLESWYAAQHAYVIMHNQFLEVARRDLGLQRAIGS